MGGNECKGKGACGSADHSCAGQNSCKGKGWVMTSEADCKAKGGKVDRSEARAARAGRLRPARRARPYRCRSAVRRAPSFPPSVSASACARRTTATCSRRDRRSTGSRSSPRTFWSPAGGRCTCSTRVRARLPGGAARRLAVDRLGRSARSRLSARACARWRERIEPAWISDHLCWTGVGGHNLHDLLPLPYSEEALAHVVERVRACRTRSAGASRSRTCPAT